MSGGARTGNQPPDCKCPSWPGGLTFKEGALSPGLREERNVCRPAGARLGAGTASRPSHCLEKGPLRACSRGLSWLGLDPPPPPPPLGMHVVGGCGDGEDGGDGNQGQDGPGGPASGRAKDAGRWEGPTSSRDWSKAKSNLRPRVSAGGWQTGPLATVPLLTLIPVCGGLHCGHPILNPGIMSMTSCGNRSL